MGKKTKVLHCVQKYPGTHQASTSSLETHKFAYHSSHLKASVTVLTVFRLLKSSIPQLSSQQSTRYVRYKQQV